MPYHDHGMRAACGASVDVVELVTGRGTDEHEPRRSPMWFKVDDSFSDHPKVIGLPPAAVALWVRAGAWSARQLTDGYIPRAALASLSGTRAQADALVKAGLWSLDSDGWRFHDWRDYNPSGDAVDAARSSRHAAAARTNHQRWHVARGLTDPACPYCTTDHTTDR